MSVFFTKDHEWISVDGDNATVGITAFAQEQLGDVVFIELPAVGNSLDKGAEAAVVEVGEGGERSLRSRVRGGGRGQFGARGRARQGQ